MKRIIKLSKAFLGMLILSCLLECNHTTKDLTSQINRALPFSDARVQSESTIIDPRKANEIKTAKGSQFSIPGSAFVYEDGAAVDDSVKINISEYLSAADILMSGIPMTVDSAGKTYNFESAGMFEIAGKSNGKDVYLANGKAISVDFASATYGNYDFYYLDPQTGKWEKKGASQKIKTNTAKTDSFKLSKTDYMDKAPTKVVEPKKMDKAKSILDFDVNLTGFPELNVYSGIVWQYTDDARYPDPDKNKWIYKTKWDKYVLTAINDSSEYELKLSTATNSFTTSVFPVLSEKNYKKAMAVFKKNMKIYSEQLVQVSKEAERRSVEESVIRAFSINEMGVYNYDRCYTERQPVAINADFKFDKVSVNDFNTITIFLITSDDRAVVKLPKDTWQYFAFDPDKKNKILAVLPDNKIAYFSSKDFEKLDIAGIKASGNYCFTLKVSDKTINSAASLDEFINSI